MKKKGSRKKVNPSKKKKKFFFFGNKTTTFVLALVFLALVILLPFFTTGNAVNSTVTGQASGNLLQNEVTGDWLNAVKWLNLPEPLTWQELIVFIITLAILFVMLFDILSLVSIFEPWASGVIAGGMTIVASLVGVIRIICTWFITIGATLGIAAGFVEIIVSIVIFFGLIFASSPIAKWAAKRKGQKEYIKAIGSSAEAGAAIKGLRHIQKEFKRRE